MRATPLPLPDDPQREVIAPLACDSPRVSKRPQP